MAYQNVGTPRFYVDIFQWLKSQGMLSIDSSQWETENLSSLIGINPTEQIELIPSPLQSNVGYNDTIVYYILQGNLWKKVMPNDKNFFMVLGHNLQSAKASIYLQEHTGAYDSLAREDGLINYQYSASNSTIENDGFSISIGNNAHDVDTNMIKFRIDCLDSSSEEAVDYPTNPKIGSLLYGTYYDMPNSPDLSLKLSYEYDGVKTIQTRGGATLSNATYTKPANWGDIGCWQLGKDEFSQNYRSGRRIWDLSFSYIDSRKLMPSNATTNNLYSSSHYSSDTLINDFGYTSDDVQTATNNNGAFRENILTSDDFFSQVFNKTMGGHLPFIFQPNGNLNLADQFAICRFDMESLSYDQIAPNTYNVKLKIREVW